MSDQLVNLHARSWGRKALREVTKQRRRNREVSLRQWAFDEVSRTESKRLNRGNGRCRHTSRNRPELACLPRPNARTANGGSSVPSRLFNRQEANQSGTLAPRQERRFQEIQTQRSRTWNVKKLNEAKYQLQCWRLQPDAKSGGDRVAGFQHDDVARHYLFGWEKLHVSVAADACGMRANARSASMDLAAFSSVRKPISALIASTATIAPPSSNSPK